MTLHIGGGNNPNKIYFGNQPVSKIYKGSTVVWQAPSTSNTITHEGVTYTFQNPVTYGYYETGEPWVVGPATLISISPDYATAADGRDINGAHLNPQFNQVTALDGHFTGYDPANRMSFPANLAVGDVVVKGIGAASIATQNEIRSGVMTAQSALFVRSSAPVGKRAAPAPFGWAGRGVPQDYPFDAAAIAATLPVYSTAGHTNIPTFASLQGSVGKYTLGAAATKNAVWSGGQLGYESMGVRPDPAASTSSNYGRWQAGRIGAAGLALISDAFTTAQKADILRWLVRYGIGIYDAAKGSGLADSGNGGHWQFAPIPITLALKYTGRETEIPLINTHYPGALGQIITVTQQLADSLVEPVAPHSDPTLPRPTTLRPIDAVSGNTITITETGQPYWWDYRELEVVRQSDGASATVTGTGQQNATGNFTIDTQPSSPFQAGDQIWFRTKYPLQQGWVEWTLTNASELRKYNPSPSATYREITKFADDVMVMKALGAWHSDFNIVEKYVAMSMHGPISGQYDYPDQTDSTYLVGSGNWGAEMWVDHATAIGIDTTYKQVSSQPGQFPAITKSAKFPDQNDWAASGTVGAESGFYSQPTTGISNWGGDGTAFFASVYLPKSKRRHYITNKEFGVMGSYGNSPRTFRLYYQPKNHFSAAERGRFLFRFRGSVGNQILAKSQIVPDAVENIMIVVTRTANGADSDFQVDFYDMDTGTLYAGTPTTVSGVGVITTSSRSHFHVGTNEDNNPAVGNGRGWPGSIAHVGYIETIPSTADWQAICNGADPVTQIGETHFKWYRRLDGSASIAASVSGDVLPALAPLAGHTDIYVGPDFTKQTTNYWIVPGQIEDGHVFGVSKANQNQGIVRLSGKAGGYSGQIEARLLKWSDDSEVVGWTSIGTIAGDSTWSGTLTAPRSTDSLIYAQVRPASHPDDVAEVRGKFGVGYKIAYLGQSQLEIWSNRQNLSKTPANRNSYVLEWLGSEYDLREVTEKYPISDGIAVFADRFRSHLGDSTPVQLIDWAESGTGMMQLIDDTNAGRDWADLQKTIDDYGNDVTVVVHQWLTSDKQNSDFDDILQALVHGTGPRAKDHSLDASLWSNYVFAWQPGSRHSNDAVQTVRAQMLGVSFANTFNHPVGPGMHDLKINDAGGPHQHDADERANPRFGRRLADTAAVALGLETRALPYWNIPLATMSATEIRIPLVTTGSGMVNVPTVIRNWELNGTEITTITYDLVTKEVVITGTFANGDVITLNPNGETRPNGDGVAEDAIIDGFFHEDDWVIAGMISGGKWIPEASLTVSGV